MIIKIHYFMKYCQLATSLLLNLLICNHYKGSNSNSTDAILTNLDVHQRIMVIHICIHIKFHQIPFIGYLVMAPGGREGRTDGGHWQN